MFSLISKVSDIVTDLSWLSPYNLFHLNWRLYYEKECWNY